MLTIHLEWQEAKASIEMLETSNAELVSSKIELQAQTDEFLQTLAKQEQEITKMKEQNSSLRGSIEEKDAKIKRIREIHAEELSSLKKELEKKEQPMPSRGSSSDSGETVVMTATAYTAYCNGCSGKTATGINLRKNPNLKVIAVDPKVIPLGTKVHVEGYGYAIAGDTGGAIKGNKIDIFIPNQKDALKWGRQKVKVKILD